MSIETDKDKEKKEKKECTHDYKYDELRGGFEYEYYECTKCGDFYKIYYDDIR